jgi:nucleotide-binding universal stress UspA family protein
MFHCILAAIDNSERTKRVMEVVSYLAEAEGTSIHLLHADEAEAVYDQVVDLEEDESAQAVVNREISRFRSDGIAFTGEVVDVLHEDVADLILTRARELGSDLIVLGPRHHSRFAALARSSVSLEVSLGARASVLLVI